MQRSQQAALASGFPASRMPTRRGLELSHVRKMFVLFKDLSVRRVFTWGRYYPVNCALLLNRSYARQSIATVTQNHIL